MCVVCLKQKVAMMLLGALTYHVYKRVHTDVSAARIYLLRIIFYKALAISSAPLCVECITHILYYVQLGTCQQMAESILCARLYFSGWLASAFQMVRNLLENWEEQTSKEGTKGKAV